MSNENAASYFFNDLAESNASQETTILGSGQITEPAIVQAFERVTGQGLFFLGTIRGTQKVVPNKRPGEPAKLIYVSMAVFRFAPQETDFLVSLNTEVQDLSR